MRSSRVLFCFFVLCAVGAFTQWAPVAYSQANVQGQWTTLPHTTPVNPIHVSLLHNGKVLIVSGSGNTSQTVTDYESAIWDPIAGTITTQPVLWDMFCNGMVVMPDGRVFIAGGTLQYDPFYGQTKTSAYDPATNLFTDLPPMTHGRWYPTTIVLGDGRVMVFSGMSETGATNSNVEIYSPGSGWGPPLPAPWTPPLYPRLHVLPDGTVFYSGYTSTSSIFNPTTNAWTIGVATTNYGGNRIYGSSVLLPLTPANGYTPRVMILGGGNPATATTELIDLSVSPPQWVYGPNMSAPRIEMDATILPNGKILASGGSKNDEDSTTASLNPDLYDPATNTFSSAGTDAFDRLYHSVTLLLPDATVWVAGSNPTRGTYEPHMEIYSPPYLFNSDGSLATRPTIASAPSAIGYGNAFQVQTPDAANISSVVMMRNGSSTHAFDMDQRYVGLSFTFTPGSGVLNVTAPPSGNIAPPGYYMLFILNNAGVPSVASMVQISTAPGDTPPTGTITTPSTNINVGTATPTTFAGMGTSPNGTIAGYSWYFEGGTPNTATGANPPAVTYATPGTYVATLTVTDNQGQNDPSPPSRTITVTPTPPSLVSVTPNSGTGITQTFSLVYSDPNGVSDLKNTRVLFNASVSAGSACYVTYSPATNQMFLYTDAGTSTSAAVTPGSSATTSNSQCTLNGAGSSFSTSGNNLTLNVSLTFSSAFAGTKNVYMYATGNLGTTVGWTQKGTWTRAPSSAPTLVSLTPSSGSGASQTFSMIYSDPNGVTDLKTTRVMFNTSVSAGSACYVTYSPATNQMFLYTDAGTSTSAAITPGSSATASNSQCTLNGTGSSFSTSGNNLTLNASLTFSSTFVGTKNVYMYATTNGGTTVGWTQMGTWTPATASAPTLVSLTPSSGSGTSQTFSMVYSDPNGVPDLKTTRVMFNTSVSAGSACYVTYSPATNQMFLYTDAGTSTSAAITPGSSATASNSQCTLNGTGSSFSTSGNNLTLNASLTFSSTFVGTKNVYMYATTNGGTTVGWTQMGTWTPATASAPTLVSLTPSSGSGTSQTFSMVYSDPNGVSDLKTTRVMFNTSVSAGSACYVTYSPATNQMFLYTDAGTSTSAAITPGSSATASNSQCTLNGTGSSFSTSGNNLTLNVALTFSSSFLGSKNVYMYATTNGGTTVGWTQMGTWTPGTASAPTLVSLTPNSGSALTQTFAMTYGDANGLGDLKTVRVLLNASVSAGGACYVTYTPSTNQMLLYNDAGTSASAAITPGSSATASNSQCTLNGTGSSFTTSGNNLTLNVALTFSSGFVGTKNVYMYATGNSGATVGWTAMGTWIP